MRFGVLARQRSPARTSPRPRASIRGDGRDVLPAGRSETRASGRRALLRADGAVRRPARGGAVRRRVPREGYRALGRRPQLGVRLRARPAGRRRVHVHRQARPRDPCRRRGRAGEVRVHHRWPSDQALVAVRRGGDRREPGAHSCARRARHRCVDRGERLVRRRGRRRADRRARAPGRREGEDPGKPCAARRPLLSPDLQDHPRRAAGDGHRAHQGLQGRPAPRGRGPVPAHAAERRGGAACLGQGRGDGERHPDEPGSVARLPGASRVLGLVPLHARQRAGTLRPGPADGARLHRADRARRRRTHRAPRRERRDLQAAAARRQRAVRGLGFVPGAAARAREVPGRAARRPPRRRRAATRERGELPARERDRRGAAAREIPARGSASSS